MIREIASNGGNFRGVCPVVPEKVLLKNPTQTSEAFVEGKGGAKSAPELTRKRVREVSDFRDDEIGRLKNDCA